VKPESTKLSETIHADEVYFDGNCPMCRNLAAHYGTERESERTKFVPLQTDGVTETTGATQQQLMELMHIRAADGRVLTGADGVVYLLSRQWWGRPLAPMFNLPGTMPLARSLYGLLARNRIRVSAFLLRLPYWLPILWLGVCALLLATVPVFSILEFMFLLAPMVIVPTLVGHLPARRAGNDFSLVEFMPLIGASLLVAASFAVPKGYLALALVVPWIVLAVIRASRWLGRIGELLDYRSSDFIANWIEAFADAFLLVAVSQLATARLGFPNLGFSDEIILLTAVHFHFSGFISLNLALIASRIHSQKSDTISRFALPGIVGLILSVPFIAIGFFLSITMKVIGVAILTLSILNICWLYLLLALRAQGRASLLLYLAAASPVFGMTLSMIYVTGEWVGQEFISIPTMAVTHGILNGIGFCLCALWGLLTFKQQLAK